MSNSEIAVLADEASRLSKIVQGRLILDFLRRVEPALRLSATSPGDTVRGAKLMSAGLDKALEALDAISANHIPDCPPHYTGDELAWAQRYVADLRRKAELMANGIRAALAPAEKAGDATQSHVNAFERHPALAREIERMASTGNTGSLLEWQRFTDALNAALVPSGTPAAWIVQLKYGPDRWSGDMLTDFLPSDMETYRIIRPLYATPTPPSADVDAGAKFLCEIVRRTAWDSVREGRAADHGFDPWKCFNARKDDYRDAARTIQSAAPGGGARALHQTTWPFPGAEWARLSIELRRRWWKETDYGKLEPSADLLAVCRAHLNAGQMPKGTE